MTVPRVRFGLSLALWAIAYVLAVVANEFGESGWVQVGLALMALSMCALVMIPLNRCERL